MTKTATAEAITLSDFMEGLLPLDEAIAKYGEDEVIGGDGMTLSELRGRYPTQVI